MFNKRSGRIFPLLFTGLLSLGLTGLSQTSSNSPQIGSTAKPDQFVLTTTVTNKKGGFVTGLRKDDFQVFFDNKPANIISISEADVPVSIGILFDASGSVAGQHSDKGIRKMINSFQEGLKRVHEVSNKSNEYFLMAFNSKPQLLADWTSDSNPLLNSIAPVKPYGGTAVYDACYLAIDKLQHGRYSKRVLILMSDGQDSLSNYSFRQVREALRESDVLLYSINFTSSGGGALGVSSMEMEGNGILQELSFVSGGLFMATKDGRPLKASEAAWAFESIANELSHQYSIGVQPQTSNVESKWHKLKVKVQRPAAAPEATKHLSVRTREGFYLNHR